MISRVLDKSRTSRCHLSHVWQGRGLVEGGLKRNALENFDYDTARNLTALDRVRKYLRPSSVFLARDGRSFLDCTVLESFGAARRLPQMETQTEGSSPKSSTGSHRREVERLLLEVFSSLPEPDSIYGVPASAADLSAQATVYAHEGGWQNTLPAYDTLLQQPSMAVTGIAGAGVDNGGGALSAPETRLQTGIACSLQV